MTVIKAVAVVLITQEPFNFAGKLNSLKPRIISNWPRRNRYALHVHKYCGFLHYHLPSI